MTNKIGAHLVELQADTQTIGNQMIGIEPFYFCHQPASHLDGGVMKIAFKPHDSTNAAAVSDTLYGFYGYFGNKANKSM